MSHRGWSTVGAAQSAVISSGSYAKTGLIAVHLMLQADTPEDRPLPCYRIGKATYLTVREQLER